MFFAAANQLGIQAQSPASMPAPAVPATRSFATIDAIMQAAIARGNIPGGVVLVGHNGKVVFRKAYGMRSLEPVREEMTPETIFDLASLTKCIATTTSILQLISEGRIRLNDPVGAYLPEFKQNGKQDITVREHFRDAPGKMRPSPLAPPLAPKILFAKTAMAPVPGCH